MLLTSGIALLIFVTVIVTLWISTPKQTTIVGKDLREAISGLEKQGVPVLILHMCPNEKRWGEVLEVRFCAELVVSLGAAKVETEECDGEGEGDGGS